MSVVTRQEALILFGSHHVEEQSHKEFNGLWEKDKQILPNYHNRYLYVAAFVRDLELR